MFAACMEQHSWPAPCLAVQHLEVADLLAKHAWQPLPDATQHLAGAILWQAFHSLAQQLQHGAGVLAQRDALAS